MRNFKNNDKFEYSFNNKIENLNLEFENKNKKKWSRPWKIKYIFIFKKYEYNFFESTKQ